MINTSSFRSKAKKSIMKPMSLKKFLIQELEKRGIDRYTKHLKEMCSEIQSCMIEYQEQYSVEALS